MIRTRRRPGHAPDGRAVRRRRDHRRGAGQRRAPRGAGLPLFLRHAGRGGASPRPTPSATWRPTSGAIHAIGQAARGRGIYEGPGISIKLSALHPRYSRAQRERVHGRAASRGCKALALLAAALRHRPQHRRRGSRPAGALARPARAPAASSRSWRAGTASASSSRPTRSAARS